MKIYQNNTFLYEVEDVNIREDIIGVKIINFLWNNCPFDDPTYQGAPFQIQIGNAIFGTCHITSMNGNIDLDIEMTLIR
jgi:hypothetical protein